MFLLKGQNWPMGCSLPITCLQSVENSAEWLMCWYQCVLTDRVSACLIEEVQVLQQGHVQS